MSRHLAVVLLAVALVAGATSPALGTFPFGGDEGGDVYDYTRLRIADGACPPNPATSDLPSTFDCADDWKLTSMAAQPGDSDYDPIVANNPQELNGVKGSSTNLAWEVTTGRPDTVIAVMDSGIRWDENRPDLVNKFFLNPGELPRPDSRVKKGTLRDYDVNGDGVFNVKDYAADPRARDLPDDGNTFLDPSDLIRTFSDGVDDDGNGYVDDISGWDFFEGDNDANDDVDYGHGTGESEDSAGEAEVSGIDPQCPNCMLLEMRVGDSFVADVNHFAEAVVYAVDNGASVIQSALGTLNNTRFAQDAVDHAYENGVVFMASQADESAGHHNMPSALNHTLLANSVTSAVEYVQSPKTYLAFNGCTNFGGYSWISVASTSCSSDAIGQSSGMAGLLYSAARNAVDKGVIAQRDDTAGRPLSAEEAKQLFRLGADDIDFSTPKPPVGGPNNFATTLPASQRFVTTANWDQVTGWGRINANKMVRLVEAGTIPPEADIVSPRWWQTLPASGSIDIVGRAAAPRLKSGETFTYEVQFAPGVQGGCPGGCVTGTPIAAADTWTTVFASEPRSSEKAGTLATLDLAAVRAGVEQNNLVRPAYNPANDPTSRELPEQDAFRVRVVTCVGACDDTPDYDTNVAIEQRHYFVRDDPTLLTGWPRNLDGDGAGSAAFDDLDGDNVDEMILSDGNGYVHAYKADGTEPPGWPVRSFPIALPAKGRNAYSSGAVDRDVRGAFLVGSPAVADLDGDGSPEVSAADIEGNLYVWHADGSLRAGFPVRGNPAYSEEPGCDDSDARPACDDYSSNDVRDEINTVDRGFTAPPATGDLDPTTPGLELVIGSNDGHVYAFSANGEPIAGWPVFLRDPAKVKTVDPVTHKVTFVDGSDVQFGRKVITTPTLGDVDGDGDLEVATNVNEEYAETPNVSPARAATMQALGAAASPGNTRVYLLHHDGTAHAESPEHAATAHPDDHAYVDGWPVAIAMVQTELLPYVGEGSNGPPVMADVDGDGSLEIATASIASPPYLLRADGSSFYGDAGGAVTMAADAAEFKNPTATDGPAFASLGGGVFGRLGGESSPFSFAMGATGLKRLLDVILPEQQLGAEDFIGSWNAATGTFDPGFPAQINDLMFFNTPAIADVTGDGRAEVLQSSAMYDLRAYSLGGVAPTGWPKFTGGWSVAAPGLGDLDGDGTLEVALNTREGNLFVWKTAGSACQTPEWPKYQANLWNSGVHGVDAKRPGRPAIVSATPSGDLTVSPSGDDGACGRASAYRVSVDGRPVSVATTPGPAGLPQLLQLGSLPRTLVTITVQTVDDAGNASFPTTVQVDNRGRPVRATDISVL